MGFTARYDPVTDKISGCKEGTITYFHEEGHRFLHKKGIREVLQTFSIHALIGAVFILAIIPFKLRVQLKLSFIVSIIPLLFSIICIIFFYFDEFFAWIYAFYKKGYIAQKKAEPSPAT